MRIIRNKIEFPLKDFKGSRLRCMMLTNSPRKQIARCLTELVQPHGVVDSEKAAWMPQGFLQPDEARLSQAERFLNPENRRFLSDWWLAVNRGANTPNWDLVATCKIDGKDGLILVEAKAHMSELDTGGKTPLKSKSDSEPPSEDSLENHKRIGAAIEEANNGMKTLGSGWALSRDSHYQLCNRFAWSWKLASLGIPVILVYLGFLNVEEMPKPFPSAGAWSDAVLEYSRRCIPESAWGSKLIVDKTPFYPIIRSLDVEWVPFLNIT